MASQFVGRLIEVTLQHPPNVLVQGVVANVIEQTTTLILQDAYFPADGRRMPFCSVEGSQIADIKIIDPTPSQAPPLQNVLGTGASFPSHNVAPTANDVQKPFVDPAVLSMGKRPSLPPQAPLPSQTTPFEAPATPLKLAAAAPPPTNVSPFVGEAKKPVMAKHPKKQLASQAALAGPTSGLNIRVGADKLVEDDTDGPIVLDNMVRRASVTKTRTGKPMDGPSEVATQQKKKSRKARLKKQEMSPQRQGVAGASQEAAQEDDTFKGKGWRQTPILQEADESPSRTPGIIAGKVGQQAISATRKKSRRQKALEKDAARNGWATEDATDIQDLPEFDFASNLSKFDKRSVFDQIRNEDTTADEDRLVSFNKLPARPGTYGGKNLHPTENVLDGSVKGARRNSLDATSSDEFEIDSGRNSRRAMSRASAKRAPLRSNSNLAEDSPAAGAASSGHSGMPSRTRAHVAALGLPRASYSSHSHSHGSPNLNAARFTPPTSPTLDRVGSFSSNTGHFQLTHSRRRCPYITPGGMLAVEETAEVEFGLPSDIISENAGRGIAQVVLKALNAGGQRLTNENMALNGRPVCLFLVGNHKAGARAAIAARHLLGRGIRVVVCVLGYERMAAGASAELDRELRQQLDVLKKLGGNVRGWPDIAAWLRRPTSPAVEAVVDALLLAGGKILEGLAPEDQRHALEAIAWAGATTGRLVVSIDAPSGMNGSTGELFLDPGTNQHVCVLPKHVVCLGAPRIGLLRALQRIASGQQADVRLECSYWVVDIGVNKAWKHFGAPGGKVVGFGGDWVVSFVYIDAAD